MRPRCFSKAILYHGAPLPSTGSVASHVPRRHRYYQSTTTSCADYGVAYFLAPPPQPILSLFAPMRRRDRWAWSRSSPVPLATLRLVKHTISQVRGEPIPYLCPALGSRPVHRSPPCRPDDAIPTLRTMRTLDSRIYRDSITRLQYPLPTLQVARYRAHMQGSLPVGG